MENQDLFDWYLARLRKLAWVDETQHRATPLTQVQTDKQVLQELVLSGTDTWSARVEKFVQRALAGSVAEPHLLMISLIGLGIVLLGFFH